MGKALSTSVLESCRKFLGRDPVANVLPLGDLYPPLLQASTVYCAAEAGQVVGVCTVYHAYSSPSIALGDATQEAKQLLVDTALSNIPNQYISLCTLADVNIFKKHSTIMRYHLEQQMIAAQPRKIECSTVTVEKVCESELESLNKFYVEHDANAWVPLQFKCGPYYCVKKSGNIVSAAGVHLVTPQIAQLGNIVTDENCRNRGYATACTSTLASSLASKKRTVSLYVNVDNAAAIHMYQKLGFLTERRIAFLTMKKSCNVNKIETESGKKQKDVRESSSPSN